MTRKKLVRDKIPDIMRKQGKKPKIYHAESIEYKEYLRKKLQEEVDEFLESETVEELADIMEVVFALSDFLSTKREKLEYIRNEKFRERGGFSDRIILEL